MGEYAKYRGDEIKIGTCESMYYLRYEDRHLVEWIRGNVDASRDAGLLWRLPFPDEDGRGPGNYEDYGRGIQLRRGDEWLRCPELAAEHGLVQMTHECGYLLNVPCYHGEKLPHGVQWNGRSGGFYELAHVKNMHEGTHPDPEAEVLKPVIRCRFCRQAWRCEWAEVLEWIPDPVLRARLERHAHPVAV